MAVLARSPRTGTSVVPDRCTEDSNEIAERAVGGAPLRYSPQPKSRRF